MNWGARMTEAQLAEINARHKPTVVHRSVFDGSEPERKPEAPPEPLEHDTQVAVFQWWALNWRRIGALDECQYYAIPNAGAGPLRGQAGKLRAEGVRAGVLDTCLDCARGGFHGLKIELKRKGKKPRPQQDRFLRVTRLAGYNSLVCHSFDECVRAIEAYMRQPAT